MNLKKRAQKSIWTDIHSMPMNSEFILMIHPSLMIFMNLHLSSRLMEDANQEQSVSLIKRGYRSEIFLETSIGAKFHPTSEKEAEIKILALVDYLPRGCSSHLARSESYSSQVMRPSVWRGALGGSWLGYPKTTAHKSSSSPF